MPRRNRAVLYCLGSICLDPPATLLMDALIWGEARRFRSPLTRSNSVNSLPHRQLSSDRVVEPSLTSLAFSRVTRPSDHPAPRAAPLRVQPQASLADPDLLDEEVVSAHSLLSSSGKRLHDDEPFLPVRVQRPRRLTGPPLRSISQSSLSMTFPQFLTSLDLGTETASEHPALSALPATVNLAGCGPLAVAAMPAADGPSLQLSSTRIRPRYLRSFVWSTGKRRISPTALATESDPPLPGVPVEAFANTALVHTVTHNPHLFKTETPISVVRLEKLLETHPNRTLVASFCKGLREGFWPWSTPIATHPVTIDGSKPARSDTELAFLEKTRDEEIAAGHFSEGFPALLPGMHVIPIHGVPKPHSEKLRLVTNFSGGKFSRNSTISRFDTNNTHFDGIRELADHLRTLRREHGPDAELTVFKSDVKGAFKVLPMSIMWQPWQVYRIANSFHVDRAATFGCSASPPIWTTFAGLVLWIAMVIYHITALYAFMDDFFSVQLASDVLFYEPYKCWFPSHQTRLLLLWDWLGIPHSQDKQLFGQELVVIGFLVDTRLMRITIPDAARTEFTDELRTWAHRPSSKVRRSLREWQALAGYSNWVLNVFPLLKPALCNVYDKMEGKSNAHAPIVINEAVRRDLTWFADHVERSDGIFLIKSVDYRPEDANLIIYCDASTHGDGRGGMGFYIPALTIGYQSELPTGVLDTLKIFFYEALCVCAAIHHASTILPRGSRLTVYTDSSNTVDIFNSLKALPSYNDILKSAIDVQLAHDIELRVLHVPGDLNKVADAISRWRNLLAAQLVPGLTIHPFSAPLDALWAATQ
ncbi:hypothetical protein C8R47DRAFT_1282131 [Mycena vitilis]|nr:hypothetical protein C8R47DRAFT_1282131 [Mycena vitilis]